MDRMLVLYQSKYGATRRYAEWIGAAMACKCKEVGSAGIWDVRRYQTFVLCGAVYARGITGLSFIRKYFEGLKDKQLLVLAVGANPPTREVIENLKKRNLPPPFAHIPLFYLRGTWREREMTLRDRMLVRTAYKALLKRDPATFVPWERTLYEVHTQEYDWVNRLDLEPLIDYLKTHTAGGSYAEREAVSDTEK